MTQASATHEAATNKLLYAASIDAGAGPWGLEVVIQRGDETSSAQVRLLLPQAVTLVFVLHQCLVEPGGASA